MAKEYKFKRHESFYIRDGWFQKALMFIISHPNMNIFSDGVRNLGIGSNMVKSLKYWLTVSGIIKSGTKYTELTDFGRLIADKDPYFENNFTWWIIHFNICKNDLNAPLFNSIFNSNISSFTKNDIIKYCEDKLNIESANGPIKKDYLDTDTSICLKSYIAENIDINPEDNYVCPLSSLKLIKKNKDVFVKTKPVYKDLSYLIIYYALIANYKSKSFIIEDVMNQENSPFKIFNLDKNSLLQYLDEMRKNELIIINKTAGLNTVYFDKKLSLNNIFDLYFGGKENVQ